MLVVHELEVRQGELLLQQFGELLLNWLCPLAHQHNELVNSPCYSATGHLRVVALELGIQVLGLSTEILLELRSSPYDKGQVRVIGVS